MQLTSSSTMRWAVHLLIIAIAVPALRAFQVSWLTAPNEIEQQYVAVPSYRYERQPPWPHASRHSSVMLDEDNQVCARFRCSRKPCCAGECIDMFGRHICILLPRYPRYPMYGRRRR